MTYKSVRSIMGKHCPHCGEFIQTPGHYQHIPKCGGFRRKKPLLTKRKNKSFIEKSILKLLCPYCQKYFKILGLYLHIKKCKYKNPIKSSSKKTIIFSGIYFIQCKNYIKIGRTTNIIKRMVDIQSLNPFPLRLLLFLKGGSKKEASLHAKFSIDRVHGEWFTLSLQMKKYIIKKQSKLTIDTFLII